VLRCFKGLEAAIHRVICGVIQWIVHVIGSSSEVWLLSELDCRDRDLSYPTLLSTNQQIRIYSARGRAMKEVEEEGEGAKRRKTLLDTHTRPATSPRKPSLLMAVILTQLRAPLGRDPPYPNEWTPSWHITTLHGIVGSSGRSRMDTVWQVQRKQVGHQTRWHDFPDPAMSP